MHLHNLLLSQGKNVLGNQYEALYDQMKCLTEQGLLCVFWGEGLICQMVYILYISVYLNRVMSNQHGSKV